MKLIILGAGGANSVSLKSDVPPKCLSRYDDESRILDKTLEIGDRIGCTENVFIGGYRILDVIQAYPELRYHYNPFWENTGSLATLMRAVSELNDDLIIVYSDVVHESSVIERMLREEGDVIVGFDSLWKHRYEGRRESSVENIEIVKRESDGVISITRKHLDSGVQNDEEELGEFTGLLVVRRQGIGRIVPVLEVLSQKDDSRSLISIVSELGADFRVVPVDLSGRWAELDSESDLEQFKFGTKAETLSRLQDTLSLGVVLPQEMITVSQWRDHPDEVLKRLRDSFSKDGKVVVRSSGLAEDSEVSSMAGEFDSVLDVAVGDNESLSDAISKVCSSFEREQGEDFDENQVLVQPMLKDVVCAGVVFTEDLETSAPYYIINYDESGSTDSITSGSGGEHRILVIAKNSKVETSDLRMKALVDSIREIEDRTGYHALDIEFAIKSGSNDEKGDLEVFILQVRPIAAQKDKLRVSAEDVDREILSIQSYIQGDRGSSSTLCGSEVAFGVMPDWNPAEIIGTNPRPLAFSLYREIITDQVWGESRTQCGYRATAPRPGIVSFAGKPYVDCRMSFTSFVPATLEARIADRLVNHAIKNLREYPELHDKVEFGVMPTAYELNFSSILERLQKDGFTGDECDSIEESYRKLTNDIILGRTVCVGEELEKVTGLIPKRERVKSRIAEGLASWRDVVDLLEDCRQQGTLPFSNLARFAFIGMIQLKGLVARGMLTQQRSDQFLASIETVAKDFINDLAGESREELVERYGHLRPGTYDITCPAYHEQFDEYVDLGNRPEKEGKGDFQLSEEESRNISEALLAAGFKCSPRELLSFVKLAIVGREKGKFEFTKNLSLAMDLMINLAAGVGISRNDLSYLSIFDLSKLAGSSFPNDTLEHWHDLIARNKRLHTVSSAIKLPPLIFGESDVKDFYLPSTQPNFITQKVVTAKVKSLSSTAETVTGKICLIENADPGFDWLFSHNIAGLITAYGGANSHMAIRCAEFEIPAAIGCGESLFKRLSRAQKILLDCGAQRIELIS